MKKLAIFVAVVMSMSAQAQVFGNGTQNKNTNANTNINTTANTNVNTQGQQQGQVQGQQQGQQQGQIATGGDALGIGVGGAGGAGGSSSSRSSANNANSVNNSVTIEAQERNPVSTATAPALSAANGTCMGSSSLGAQGVSFGLSVGSTWTDSGCDARYDAAALRAAGHSAAAMARLCQKPEIAQAMKESGTPCKSDKSAAAPVEDRLALQTPAASAPAKSAVYSGNDPVVKARLGIK